MDCISFVSSVGNNIIFIIIIIILSADWNDCLHHIHVSCVAHCVVSSMGLVPNRCDYQGSKGSNGLDTWSIYSMMVDLIDSLLQSHRLSQSWPQSGTQHLGLQSHVGLGHIHLTCRRLEIERQEQASPENRLREYKATPSHTSGCGHEFRVVSSPFFLIIVETIGGQSDYQTLLSTVQLHSGPNVE